MALSDVTLKAKTHKDESGNLRKAPYKLYDEMGLYVQVTASGGKCWRLKYRFAGKEKLLAIGTYPEVGLADARARHDDARKLLAQNPPVDPSEVKKSQKQAIYAKHQNTFKSLAREWGESYFTNKSDSHKECILRRLEIDTFHWLANVDRFGLCAQRFQHGCANTVGVIRFCVGHCTYVLKILLTAQVGCRPLHLL